MKRLNYTYSDDSISVICTKDNKFICIEDRYGNWNKNKTPKWCIRRKYNGR
ncbi:MAG: hypothetical protein E7C49_00015 [Clostridium sp.]|nr:hypothetical protein [Clostridium sp.]